MSESLDRFFAHYYQRRPVNATFTGVHEFDTELPDWSEQGLWALDAEMHALVVALAEEFPELASDETQLSKGDTALIDARLAHGFLQIQIAENASRHGVRGNPALWSGEAVFSIASLMMRNFAPIEQQVASAIQRLQKIPDFLAHAESVLRDAQIPASWLTRAARDCVGAERLLTLGLTAWVAEMAPTAASPARDTVAAEGDGTIAGALRTSANRALQAFARFSAWLAARQAAPDTNMACGSALFDLLLVEGHQSRNRRGELLDKARGELVAANEQLHALAEATAGSWERAQAMMTADHAAPEGYLDAFARTWARCHEHAVRYDVVTWPDWPIRYTTFPVATRDAAPFLYYLYYRSPAPFDPYTTYEYVVPPLPEESEAVAQHMRAWNQSAVTLNHVVHHGAVGHHVQNWHAYHRAPSRIGRIAAVDTANRIGMFCGGTMAEGWACYATLLMEELDFLSPLERLSERHTRVRFLARAIVDIELHQGTMSPDEAIAFYIREVGMHAHVARAEVVKNSMFPCTALMYWLGTMTILELRAVMKVRLGHAFTLKRFHDSLLGYGSLPVPLVARLMTADAV